MIKLLLQSLTALDYIFLTVKASDHKLTKNSAWLYKQVQDLYGSDLGDRILGAFTFSDGSKPLAKAALEAVQINLAESFKF